MQRPTNVLTKEILSLIQPNITDALSPNQHNQIQPRRPPNFLTEPLNMSILSIVLSYKEWETFASVNIQKNSLQINTKCFSIDTWCKTLNT